MRVECLVPFYDKDKKCRRAVGDVWECSKERFDEMNSSVFGVLVKEGPAKKPSKKDDKE